jgi:leucyl aminopeptidase
MFDPKSILLQPGSGGSIKLHPVSTVDWQQVVKRSAPELRSWAAAQGFVAEPGSYLPVAGKSGKMREVYAGVKPDDNGYGLCRLARLLPAGRYEIAAARGNTMPFAEFAWLLESYSFERFKPGKKKPAMLVCRRGVDYARVLATAAACCMVRDLVNMPANDMGPDELEAACRNLARRHKAKAAVIKGKSLERDFPMVHKVGMASERPPRLFDMSWGPSRAPKVTLVGKGVCFDTGGLDIKPASGMALMKKDMGGAAHVLGLASMIMQAKLPVRLRVIVPIVENSIAGNAMRPGDIYRTRKGLTVEIGNTDAEGRLILCDALHLADADKPDLLIDMATLTGAARVALGPELPPFYTDDDALAAELQRHAGEQVDPLWRMPLWRPYYSYIEPQHADLNNSSESGFAGSVTAALFLRRFVEQAKSYIHFDIFAWTPIARPGSPKGGEAQAIRALFALIAARYGKSR